MFEIVPNWHPIFVHFTVGLVVASPALFLLSKVTNNERAKIELAAAGRWTLWAGALAAALTVAAGFLAFGSVAHDDASHLAMTDHRNWAVPTAILIIGLAGWSFKLWRDGKELPTAFYALLIAGTVLVGMTGLKGADLVYVHGLGVQSLPEVEAGGEGDGHDHEHDEPEATVASEDEGDGHDHEHEDTPTPAATADHDDTGSAPHSHDGDIDTSTPEGALAAFKAALSAGDGAAVSLYLAEDVLIYESGSAEKSLEEYTSHHLGADMAFLANMENEIIEQRIFMGDPYYALVVTQSRTFGTYQGTEMNINGTETVMLEMVDGQWMIKHIHWSSRRAN